MWQIKKFKTYEAYKNWIHKHEQNYQIETLYVNNAWAVEYRKLRVM